MSSWYGLFAVAGAAALASAVKRSGRGRGSFARGELGETPVRIPVNTYPPGAMPGDGSDPSIPMELDGFTYGAPCNRAFAAVEVPPFHGGGYAPNNWALVHIGTNDMMDAWLTKELAIGGVMMASALLPGARVGTPLTSPQQKRWSDFGGDTDSSVVNVVAYAEVMQVPISWQLLPAHPYLSDMQDKRGGGPGALGMARIYRVSGTPYVGNLGYAQGGALWPAVKASDADVSMSVVYVGRRSSDDRWVAILDRTAEGNLDSDSPYVDDNKFIVADGDDPATVGALGFVAGVLLSSVSAFDDLYKAEVSRVLSKVSSADRQALYDALFDRHGDILRVKNPVAVETPFSPPYTFTPLAILKIGRLRDLVENKVGVREKYASARAQISKTIERDRTQRQSAFVSTADGQTKRQVVSPEQTEQARRRGVAPGDRRSLFTAFGPVYVEKASSGAWTVIYDDGSSGPVVSWEAPPTMSELVAALSSPSAAQPKPGASKPQGAKPARTPRSRKP